MPNHAAAAAWITCVAALEVAAVAETTGPKLQPVLANRMRCSQLTLRYDIGQIAAHYLSFCTHLLLGLRMCLHKMRLVYCLHVPLFGDGELELGARKSAC